MKALLLTVLSVITGASVLGQFLDDPDGTYPYTFKAHNQLMSQEEKADERLDHYDVIHYMIDIEVDPQSTFIKGKSGIRAVVNEAPLDTFVIQLIDELTVDSVFLNQHNRVAKHDGDLIRIRADNSLTAGEEFTVTVHYHGTSIGGGVTTGYDEQYDKHVTWSLSESFHAKEWFPCKQVLADKADSASIKLTTDRAYWAVSNGLLKSRKNLDDNKVSYHWVTHYPINYYLLSFAVSDYQEYSFYSKLNEHDSVFVQNFVYNHPDYLARWKKDIDRTGELLRLYSEKFGTYPFAEEKYGHSLMKRGGGMEHQTITTINNFNYLLVAHELAHQWFGDYVTCGSWQDIWINEGFASYGEYIALEHTDDSSGTPSDWMQQAHTYAKNEPLGSVYVPFSEATNERRIFNYALSYRKGAALLHMIRYLLGDDALFFQSLRSFLNDYANDVATGEDFKQVLHSQTEVDFTGFFQQWYYGKGYPNYEVSWYNEDDSVHMDISQTASADEPALFTIPLELKLQAKNGEDTLVLYTPQTNNDHFSVRYPHEIKKIIIDPDNWVLNGVKDASQIVEDDSKRLTCKIYPNPAMDMLHVVLKGLPLHERKLVYVRDLTGILLYSRGFNKNELSLNINSLNSGVYLIEVRYDGGHFINKFVKY